MTMQINTDGLTSALAHWSVKYLEAEKNNSRIADMVHDGTATQQDLRNANRQMDEARDNLVKYAATISA